MSIKHCFKLILEKIMIKLLRVDLVGNSGVSMAILGNEKAVRTRGVLTAVGTWLPGVMVAIIIGQPLNHLAWQVK